MIALIGFMVGIYAVARLINDVCLLHPDSKRPITIPTLTSIIAIFILGFCTLLTCGGGLSPGGGITP